MKIRIMGTKEECELATKYYQELERSDENVRCMTISDLYPNRGSTTVYRLYVDVEYYSVILGQMGAQLPLPSKRGN